MCFLRRRRISSSELAADAVASILVNALPFDRQGNIRQSLGLCRAVLENPGNILLIYPEGTRTRPARLGSSGLAFPSLGRKRTAGVPCYLDGASTLAEGRLVPRPHKVRLLSASRAATRT